MFANMKKAMTRAADAVRAYRRRMTARQAERRERELHEEHRAHLVENAEREFFAKPWRVKAQDGVLWWPALAPLDQRERQLVRLRVRARQFRQAKERRA